VETLNQSLLNNIVLLCIINTDFLKIVRPALRLDYIQAPQSREFLRICYEFWDNFKASPDNHFVDEVKRLIENLPEKPSLRLVAYAERLNKLEPPNPDYVLSRVNDFVRSQEYLQAALAFSKLAGQGEFDQATSIMLEALRTGATKAEAGVDYLSTTRPPMPSEELIVSTGIEHLDSILRGYYRKQLLCFMAPAKGGKTWACQYLALHALIHGLNVLHISHEMSQAMLEYRYDQALARMLSIFEKHSREVQLRYWEADAGMYTTTNQTYETVRNRDPVLEARRKLKTFGGTLRIKKYPMATVDVMEIERCIRHLENFEGFKPDVLINDYPDIMRPLDNRKELRHQINETYVHHKRLADEMDMLVVAPSQATMDSHRRSRKPSMKDFAEDKRKAANVDTAIAIWQTEEMVLDGEAVLYVIANRVGPMDTGCVVGQCYDLGQFCLWSRPLQRPRPKPEEEK